MPVSIAIMSGCSKASNTPRQLICWKNWRLPFALNLPSFLTARAERNPSNHTIFLAQWNRCPPQPAGVGSLLLRSLGMYLAATRLLQIIHFGWIHAILVNIHEGLNARIAA